METEDRSLPPLTDGFLGDLVAHGLDRMNEEDAEEAEEGKPWEEQVEKLFGLRDAEEDEDGWQTMST